MNYKGTLLSFYILTLLTVSCSTFAQESTGYELTGKIGGLKDGELVTMNMMVYGPGYSNEVRRDSAYVKNGQFRITGNVPEGPRFYWMKFSQHKDNVYRMVIDNSQKMFVHYDDDIAKIPHQTLDNYLVTDGSPSHYAWHLMMAADDIYRNSYNRTRHNLDKIKDSLGFDKTLIQGIMMARDDINEALYVTTLFKLEPDMKPAAALFAFYQEENHQPMWAEVYDQLDEHLKNSVYGKRLKSRLPILIGQALPPFILPDSTGKKVQMSDMVSKGKMTLVHFWATNSSIRKKYDEELRAMYKKYHDKGLNIIGVSTESHEDDWKETLANEQYPWANVIDVKGRAIVDTVYHELGRVDHQNTTNVLLDAQGRIVAWDPMGVELQWYLEKYLGDDRVAGGR